jgi:RHS repeat-associated protein
MRDTYGARGASDRRAALSIRAVFFSVSQGGETIALLSAAGLDEWLALIDPSGTRSLLTDGLGSTMALTDATGNIVTQYTYDAFGVTTSSGAASLNPFQFTGRENDATGLYYYRARYHDPNRGRFASEDQAGFSAGTNLYVYASDSPVNYTDPSGLTPGDNGLEGNIRHLKNIFPDSTWQRDPDVLVIHLPCRLVIPRLLAQGYQNANSLGYNGPGSAYWNPVGHPGGFEWRTFGPGFHFRMQYPSSCSDPNCTLDQFHIDKYNPIEPGQFWSHIKCDFLGICRQ